MASRPTDPSTASTAWLLALADAALRDLAGAAVFARGVSYAAGDAVHEIELTKHTDLLHAQAVVNGTQDYAVTLDVGADGKLSSDCDCPHAQDGWFCKHQVALALCVRAALGSEAVALDAQAQKKVAAAAKRARTQATRRDALRQFVFQQSAQTLAEWLWQRAEGDRALMGALKTWAALSQSGSDWPAVKAAITAVLPPARGFLDWMEASAYARQAEPVLALLGRHAKADPVLARQACEHALLRLYKVAEEADDSNGDLGGLVQQVMDQLIDTLRAAPPPAEWVERWFELMDADPWGLWHEPDVLAAAGESVRQRHAQRATRDWQRWLEKNPVSAKPTPDNRFFISREDIERSTLRQRYLDVLTQQGDVPGTIEAMKTSARHADEWCELIEFCNRHDRQREGFQYAQQGVKRFPGDRQCENLLLAAYERDGWDVEALALRRQQFERHPWSLPDYDGLLRAAQAAGHDRGAYRDGLLAWAEQHESSQRTGVNPRRAAAAAGAAPHDVSPRVTWLLHEQRLQDALALVQPPHICRNELLWQLAQRLPEAQHAQAVALLKRVFDAVMPAAQSPYAEPLELVREIERRQSAAEFRPWLAWLRTSYKAKRNFIKGLPT